MISFALQIAFLGLLGLIVLKTAKIFLDRRWKARESAKRGCLPPPTAESKGLFGIKTLVASIRATKEERGVQFIKEEMDKIGKNVHTVRAQIFDYELLITRDTENIKAMFATQSQDFDIGPHREKMFLDLLGLGVMTGRGANWKHSRGLIRPQFAREQIMNLNLFETHVQALLKRLKTVNSDGWTSKVDMAPLFFNLTLDVSTEFLVGQSVHNQTPELQSQLRANLGPGAPDLAAFGRSLDKAKAILDRRGALAKYGWLVNSKEFPQACKTVRGFVEYFVARELAISADEEKYADNAMIGKFVLLRELAKETRDPITLRNELLNVLHAARDTTACLLGWTFYFLARYPDVFAKLRQEILTNFPNNSVEEITFNKLWGSSYMLSVLNETIRYVGIVPMNERAAVNDTTLPTGGGPDGKSPIFVPKGTQVLVPTYAMQHREDIWGPTVEEYRPERWEGRKFGWDFIPFGGGARQCIGQQFARTEAMYTIVRLLHAFDGIENLEPPGPIKYHHTIENRSGTGVQVRLHATETTILEKAF